MGSTAQNHEIQGIAPIHTSPGLHQVDNPHQDCKHLQKFAPREQITNTSQDTINTRQSSPSKGSPGNHHQPRPTDRSAQWPLSLGETHSFFWGILCIPFSF